MTNTVGGYRLVVPAGWQRITLGDGAGRSLARFIDDQLRTRSGADRVLLARELRERVAPLLAEAEASGALDVYLYDRQHRRVRVFMNFVVAMTYLGPSSVDLDEADFAEIAGVDAAEAGYIEFAAGRVFRSLERTSTTTRQRVQKTAALLGTSPDLASYEFVGDEATAVAATAQDAVDRDLVSTRTRVSYLAPVPASPGAFLLIVFDGDDGAIAESEVLLFDSIVSTLKWVAA